MQSLVSVPVCKILTSLDLSLSTHDFTPRGPTHERCRYLRNVREVLTSRLLDAFTSEHLHQVAFKHVPGPVPATMAALQSIFADFDATYGTISAERMYRLSNPRSARGTHTHLQDRLAALEEEIAALSASVANSQHAPDPVKVQAALAKMQKLVEEMRQSQIRIGPVGRRTPSQLAIKTFAIPELLETILSHLPSGDILQAYQVNTEFRNTIEGSIKIQKKLGLRANRDAVPYAPASFIRWSGSRFPRGGFNLNYDPEVDLGPELRSRLRTHIPAPTTTIKRHNRYSMVFSISMSKPLQVLGPRCGSLLVSQPPTRQLDIYTSCCRRHVPVFLDTGSPRNEPLEVITAKEGWAGITVGDVNQALKRLWPQHRMCPLAIPDQHTSDGTVNVVFTFASRIPLDKTKPWAVQQKTRRQKQREVAKTDRNHQQFMQKYVEAKRKGEYPTYTVVLSSIGLISVQRTTRDSRSRRVRSSEHSSSREYHRLRRRTEERYKLWFRRFACDNQTLTISFATLKRLW